MIDPLAATDDEAGRITARGSDLAHDQTGDGAAQAMQLASPLDADDAGADSPLAQMMMAKLFPSQIQRPKIGRFDLLEFLGEGGMGAVYLAYDERLDRRIAIKFLRAADDARAQARLLREAQALARLSHPNIVAVYEAWEEEGRVHVAMEYVAGMSLDAWQAQARPWPELVDAYRQAGEGLAAAHRAGLVHRDFKPHNAIRREEDGVVKVLDFGLARALAAAPEEDEAVDPPAPTSSGFGARRSEPAQSLTRTGAIMGTPVYMSPEQHRGAPAGPASDQFSFAVALWEALYAELPYPAGSLAELRAAVLAGARREPSASREAPAVPGWIRRIIERGMATAAEDRYPSMEALLRDLGRDPARRRRRVAALVGGLALTVAGGLGIAELRAQEALAICSGDALAAELWRGSRRATVEVGVTSAELPGGDATWRRIAAPLDAYADALVDRRAQACEDHRRGLRSDALYDREVACLDRREAGFVQLAELLAAGDPEAILQAPRAVRELPSLAECADAEALAAEHPPPGDPQVAAQVSDLREELARAHAEELAGKFTDAERRAGAVAEAAAPLDYPPLRAEADLRWGSAALQRLSDEAGPRLERALWTALRAEHRRVAAEAAAKRIYARVEIEDRGADAREAIALADALVARDGAADWRTRWLLANNTAIARERGGALREALRAYRAALAEIPAAAEGVFERAATLQNTALTLVRLGDRAAGEAAARESVAEFSALYGPEHPSTATATAILAQVLHTLGRRDEAADLLAQAIAATETATGKAPQWMLLQSARAALDRGDLTAARQACARGEAIVRATAGDASPWMLPFAAVRAKAAAREGEADAAAPLDAIDPAIRAASRGFTDLQRADVLLHLGRAAEAAALLEGTLAAGVTGEALAPETELLLGEALLLAGDDAGARRGAALLRGLLGEAPPRRGDARGRDAPVNEGGASPEDTPADAPATAGAAHGEATVGGAHEDAAASEGNAHNDALPTARNDATASEGDATATAGDAPRSDAPGDAPATDGGAPKESAPPATDAASSELPRLHEPEMRARALMALAARDAAAGDRVAALRRADAAVDELAGFDPASPSRARADALLRRLRADAGAARQPAP
ncbi:MAG: serine/threonine-protein kinase [Nannocystaceae bacterium]